MTPSDKAIIAEIKKCLDKVLEALDTADDLLPNTPVYELQQLIIAAENKAVSILNDEE